MNTIINKTILDALATHKRKHQVLYERACGRLGRTKYALNIDKLKAYHLNKVKCVELVVDKIMEDAGMKRRKAPKFLSEAERKEIQQILLIGSMSMKNISIKYKTSYGNISRIKGAIGLGRPYKKIK